MCARSPARRGGGTIKRCEPSRCCFSYAPPAADHSGSGQSPAHRHPESRRLPDGLLERYVNETGGPGRDGHSRLPWIQHVFSQNGVWMENFYVRGMSLSAPSWSLLDSGRHLQIRGNVEYDRYTLHPYDYLNFFPFYSAMRLQSKSTCPPPS